MKWMIILKRLILIRICRCFALLSIWYNNFFGAERCIPYAISSKNCSYLQQGTMESNGKKWVETGKPVNYRLELLFGRTGTNAQHAFFN
jgi:glucose-6-phosphate isomerase